jgi:hypothetical protein
LSNWKAILTSNEQALGNADYILTKLETDDRPVDVIATKYHDLAVSLIDWRSRVSDLNDLIDWYANFSLIQGEHLQTRQRAKSEKDKEGTDIRSFTRDYRIHLIGGHRKSLLTDIKKVLSMLDKVMKDRGLA